MAIQDLNRKGTANQHKVFTGGNGEITVVTDDNYSLRVHDGVTVGGHPLRDYSVVTREITVNVAAAAPNINTTSPTGTLPNGWAITGTTTTTAISFTHLEGKTPRNVWFIATNATGTTRITGLSSNNYVEWATASANTQIKVTLSSLAALFNGTPNGGTVLVRIEF